MRKLRFKGQVYAGFVIAIVIIVATASFFYSKINYTIENSKLWMQVSVDAISMLDSISRQNNTVSFERIAFLTDRDTAHERRIGDEHAAMDMHIGQLTELMERMGIATAAVDRLRTLIGQRRQPRTESVAGNPSGGGLTIADIRNDGRHVQQQLFALKQDIIAARKEELEKQNGAILQTKYIAIAGLGLAVLVLLGLIGYITKTFDLQKKAERFVRKANNDLNRLSKEREVENWILNGLAALDNKTRGGLSEKEIANNAIQAVCQHLSAKVGLIYLKSASNADVFVHVGSYAVTSEDVQPKIMKSQGLVGEAIASKSQLVLSDLPDHYLTAMSALGGTALQNIVIQPFIYEDEVLGVMEIGFFRKIDNAITDFLARAGVTLAVASKVAYAHTALTQLFEETQQQAEELEAQQEELRTTNDELVHKTHLLEASEEELRVQQEELKHANVELEEKARLLEEHNVSIEQARQSIAMKAKELEQSGKYKSEFLANMSHELRTPLNSILILAKLLEENKWGNLMGEQVKYASVIHSAGTDLLNLINNILDLSKIESGNVELIIEHVPLSNIAQDLLELFGSVAQNKSIQFRIVIDEDLPASIDADEQRLRQILKNLLSNAFKFTKEQGHVELLIAPANRSAVWEAGMLHGMAAADVICFSVTDTGIGIPIEKQQLIFEAFKQADGSTSRKFGGTGLGLSICRELASVLGGEIHVSSEEGKGSTFSLFLPLKVDASGPGSRDDQVAAQPQAPQPPHSDGRLRPVQGVAAASAAADQKRLLIIEDDHNFAEILEGFAHENGFETMTAYQGDIGVQMALDEVPDAIILDIMLPVMDGWTVLKKLKANPATKDIPVHLMSADRPSKRKIEGEAVGFLQKPVDQQSLDHVFGLLHKLIDSPLKKALLIEDHQVQSDSLKSSLVENGVDVKQAFTGAEAIDALTSGQRYDCIILDLHLPDKSGMELLDEIKQIPEHADTPVIINTAMELTQEMTAHIQRHTKTMVVKSDKSNNRILDEVNLFINKVKHNSGKPPSLNAFGHAEAKAMPLDKVLEGKRILLADDDMRNIFALTTVFASHQIQVEIANNGLEALEALKKNPAIDLVLMDIMMPEMDGYEAIAKIRAMKKFAKLPIIAITAKAMRGDRQQVLDAGANDYIAKPVEVNKLLSLMRVWLS